MFASSGHFSRVPGQLRIISLQSSNTAAVAAVAAAYVAASAVVAVQGRIGKGTSDAGSQYRCGRLGGGIQPPSTPQPNPNTKAYTKSI